MYLASFHVAFNNNYVVAVLQYILRNQRSIFFFLTLACAFSVKMVAVELNVLCKSVSILWIAL